MNLWLYTRVRALLVTELSDCPGKVCTRPAHPPTHPHTPKQSNRKKRSLARSTQLRQPQVGKTQQTRSVYSQKREGSPYVKKHSRPRVVYSSARIPGLNQVDAVFCGVLKRIGVQCTATAQERDFKVGGRLKRLGLEDCVVLFFAGAGACVWGGCV